MTTCEDLVYTLRVRPYADSREASLGSLPVGGFFSDGPLGTTIIHERSEVNWGEKEGERKAREAPEPVNLSDLQSAALQEQERAASDPVGFQKGFLACVQAQQAQPAK